MEEYRGPVLSAVYVTTVNDALGMIGYVSKWKGIGTECVHDFSVNPQLLRVTAACLLIKILN